MVEYGQDKKSSHDRRSAVSLSDIVGQEQLKQALLAVGANDALDGLLIQGEKGTAKSTAVRALRGLLGEQQVVADCPYGCPPADPSVQCEQCRERTDPPVETRPVPLVTLPLGATRERVVGTLSVTDALDGDHEFDPGLLARANRGILYVDEVNLLDDHLVDVLLDAAASGLNRVERDGVSITHPAEFTLIGTMNPEEGDLRPQLRDRFALQSTVTGCEEIEDRVAIIDQALEDGEHTEPDAGEPEASPGARLRTAREMLDEVDLPPSFKTEIAELCRDGGLDGHRGDIATARAARTLAALDGRAKVIEGDVRAAAELALPHRLQSKPFEDAPDIEDIVEEQFDDSEGDDTAEEGDPVDEADGGEEGSESERDPESGASERESDGSGADEESDDSGSNEKQEGSESVENDRDDAADGDENTEESDSSPDDAPTPSAGAGGGGADHESQGRAGDDGDEPANEGEKREGTPLVPGQSRAGIGDAGAPDFEVPEATDDGAGGTTGGSLRTTASTDGTGGRVRTEPADSERGIDAAASIRAAASRGETTPESRDLRQSVRVSTDSTLVLFVVDASASMRPAMRAAKGTVLELLEDAYQQRDEVGFVAFAGDRAEVLLPPTDSVTLAARHLKELPTGDRTPLPDGLTTAAELIDRADPAGSVVVLVTDGKANVADGSPVEATRAAAQQLAALDTRTLVVDAGGDGAGLVEPITEETGGRRIPLDSLSAERIDAAVGAAKQS